jgi:hypothetical protein
MEASEMATEGQQGEETQAAPEAPAGVPSEVTERLNELSGRFDSFEPVLGQIQQALTPQEQEAEQHGAQEYIDPETGYVLDPDGFDTSITERIQRQAQQIAQEQLGPIQQEVSRLREERTQESFADLMDEYPQLGDQEFQKTFIPHVEQAALAMAQALGHGPEAAQKLAMNPDFVETQYLARQASQQAQQQAAAGGQEVPLEGGSGQPGQPQVNETQERFKQWAQEGAGGGVFGKSMQDLL